MSEWLNAHPALQPLAPCSSSLRFCLEPLYLSSGWYLASNFTNMLILPRSPWYATGNTGNQKIYQIHMVYLQAWMYSACPSDKGWIQTVENVQATPALSSGLNADVAHAAWTHTDQLSLGTRNGLEDHGEKRHGHPTWTQWAQVSTGHLDLFQIVHGRFE